MNWLNPITRRLSDERGFALVELLVAGIITVGLVGTLGYLFVIAERNQPQVAERAEQIQDGRVAVEAITRDIREAYAVNGTPTASQLSITTFVRHTTCGGSTFLAASADSIPCRVTFTCTAGTCTRTEANPDGTNPGTAVKVVTGLSSSAVFTYQTTPSGSSQVDVSLVYPSDDGGEAVTIADGAELRNQ